MPLASVFEMGISQLAHASGAMAERAGRRVVAAVEEVGLAASFLGEGLYWLVAGRRRYQRVRVAAVAGEMMEIGIRALPINTLLSVTIGVMLAIQGIHTLRTFGAESQVVLGVALSVTREFGPLITGILVAGRSGSALAARLATMTIRQEIDALRVMGVNPIRFLVTPSLVASVVMLPALTLWSVLVAQLAAGFYVQGELGISLGVYVERSIAVLEVGDLSHGLVKSLFFACLVTLIAVVNGVSVKGGAEGVGRSTTRSVVQSVAAIIITDMLFVFVVTR